MPPVFGIDFDGVICDTIKLKQDYLRSQWGFSVMPWEANRTVLTGELGVLSDSSYDLMLETVCSRESTLSAQPMAGASKSIEKLAGEGVVYVVTGRKGFWLSSAVEWMNEQGLDDYVEGYVSSKLCNQPKLKICERMNISHLVEDDPGHFAGMKSDVIGVLLKHGYAGELPSNGVKYARGWEDALQYLI
jgi:hypothetical protein